MCPVGLPVPQDVVRQRRELVVTQERGDAGVPQVPVELGGPGAVVTCGDESGQGVTEVPGAVLGQRRDAARARASALKGLCLGPLSLSRASFCVLPSMVIRLVGVRLPAGADASSTQRRSRRWNTVPSPLARRRRPLRGEASIGCAVMALPGRMLPRPVSGGASRGAAVQYA